ncbi:hypothetical protein LB503_012842 [Fusarium chuoi]|nr:hypothetical protein LB503_012842 [Fusarium chuoi]
MSRPGSASQRVPVTIGQGQIVGDTTTGEPTGGRTTPQKEPIFQPLVGKSELALQSLNAIFAKYNDDTTISASNLPSNLSKWVKETFSQAYTYRQIAQSLQTREWRSNFTDDEKKEILYFWQGPDPKCLFSSDQKMRFSADCASSKP